MFAAGPATITATRFHVRARQYASGPSASSEVVEALLGGRGRGCGERTRPAATAQHVAASPARGVEVAGSPARGAAARAAPTSAGASCERAARSARRRRPAPGGACRGSSRSRRAGSRRCRTRSRCGSSSRSPAGTRRRTAAAACPSASDAEEVAQLVHEDQEPEADDRDEDGHAGCQPPARRAAAPRRRPRRARPGRARARRRPRRASPSTTSAMPRKRQPARQERRDGDLVRRVEGARVRCRRARPPRAPARAAGSVARSGASNSSVRPPARSSGRHGSRGALGVRERVRDRDAHVGIARGARARRRRGSARARARPRSGGRRPRSGRTASPKRKCASISSSPLFARVAESTVIFGPMLQVGCASASSGVTSASSSRVRPRNGPPEAVSTSDSTVLASRGLPGTGRPPSARCPRAAGALPRAPGPPARARPRRRGSPCSRARA